MKHFASPAFWECYEKLPATIQMKKPLKIGIIGDYDPQKFSSHISTNEALSHAARVLSVSVDSPGFPLCRLQVLRWGQLSGSLTPFGVGPGVHTKVWMGRFRRSVSLAKWDGRSSQPEEASTYSGRVCAECSGYAGCGARGNFPKRAHIADPETGLFPRRENSNDKDHSGVMRASGVSARRSYRANSLQLRSQSPVSR